MLDRSALYIHPPRGRKGRAIDSVTEGFVEATRRDTPCSSFLPADAQCREAYRRPANSTGSSRLISDKHTTDRS